MKAFTLVELLTSIAILLVLSSFFLLNPNAGPPRFELKNAAQQIEADIRKAQSFAIAGRALGTTSPLGGWGVFIRQGENCYIVFADVNGNATYDPGTETLCDASSSDPSSERLERFFLPESVSVGQLLAGASSVGDLNIIYIFPELDIRTNGLNQNAQITLESNILDLERTISVNTVGNVTVQ
jgi:prepilin-type N-terminal cleavage/methylation domain-containing protein